ncbi:MAG TPA: alpha/beta fold hydrolase [Candidatus Angelobacter sp.]
MAARDFLVEKFGVHCFYSGHLGLPASNGHSGGNMEKTRTLLSTLFILLLTALTCAAGEPQAPKIEDLTATDGIKLKVSFFAAAKPGPGVLLLHQCNRQRKIWDGLALQLAASGINVLTLDLRGFGESGDDPLPKLTPQQAQAQMAKWPGDIDVAFQFLQTQPGVEKNVIGVGGASCGVNNSVQTARRHPEVKSLVLLSGNTDLNGREFLRKPGSPPVFFAVADNDEFPASVQAIEWMYALDANSGKKFAHYAIGGHGADMFPYHPELPKMIAEWFVTTLSKTPGHAPVAKDNPPVPQEIHMLDVIDQPGGAAKAAQMLADARQHDLKAVLFSEGFVNFMGYEHMQSGDIKGAIEILELNATAYPDSANVYDSLSDAFLADGQKEPARENAKKALELLPSDTVDPPARRDGIKASAEQKLKQLAEDN